MPTSKSRPLLLTACLALAALTLSGCFTSSKKKREKEKSIPVAVEQSFKTLWLEKRSGELVQKGLSPYAAQQQARTEFAQKYAYTQVAQ